MRDVELLRQLSLDEVVHGDRLVPVVREWLAVPGEGEHPPLSVERTVRAEGPDPGRAPVILVHGFAQNRYSWRLSRRSFVAHLAAEGFEVLNFELRGHGLSREYGAGNASAFDEYVADAARVVERCRRPPFVIGHSLGGAVGIGVATETELAGLVHLAGVYGFASRNRTLRAIARLTLAWEPVLGSLPVNVSTGWAGDVISRLYAVTDIAGYGAPIAGWAPNSIERDLLDERLQLGFDWTSLAVWVQMSRWATGERLAYRERFAELDVPLLVIAGDNDPLVRPGDARDCFEESGSSDKELLIFEPFEHRVHWGHIDLIIGRHAPDEVWPRITAWLTRRS